MDWKIILWATVCGVAMSPLAARSQDDVRRDATVRVVEAAMPSVVNIGTETVVQYHDPFSDLLRKFWGPYYRGRRPDQEVLYSLGSGVIIDPEGHVLTNYHVVRRATRIWVTPAIGEEKMAADLVTFLESADLALLKIRVEDGRRFQPLSFAEEGDVRVGETVLAMGNPFGLGGSVSRGILSAKTRRALKPDEPMDVDNWLQTDASINPGNSGGPLVNLLGQVIGLNVAIYSEGQGIGFAIPVDRIHEGLSRMFTPERIASRWFGARLKAGSSPLEVVEIEADSPADQAGLRPGDRLVELNGRRTDGFLEFQRRILDVPDGESIDLTVKRDDETRRVSLRMVPEEEVFRPEYFTRRLGVTLQPMTRELAAEFGFRQASGLLVAEVEPGTSAAEIGLESGILVEGIEGVRVNDLITAGRLIRDKSPGDPVTLNIVYPTRIGGRLFLRSQAVRIRVR